MADPPQAGQEAIPRDANALAAQSPEPVESSDGLEEVGYVSQAPGPKFSKDEYHAKATNRLALLLFWALILMFATHFVSVLCLAHNKPNSVEEITRVFSTWVPVLAGLFGSAATFYFTQGRK